MLTLYWALGLSLNVYANEDTYYFELEKTSGQVFVTLILGGLFLILSVSRLTVAFGLFLKIIGGLAVELILMRVVLIEYVVGQDRPQKILIFFCFMTLCIALGHYVQVIKKQRKLRRESI